MMHLLLEVWKFLSTTFHGLTHIWIVDAPHQMIPPFSMFWDGRELENFPMGRNKCNDMDNIMNIVDMAADRGVGLDIEWPKKKVIILY